MVGVWGAGGGVAKSIVSERCSHAHLASTATKVGLMKRAVAVTFAVSSFQFPVSSFPLRQQHPQPNAPASIDAVSRRACGSCAPVYDAVCFSFRLVVSPPPLNGQFALPFFSFLHKTHGMA